MKELRSEGEWNGVKTTPSTLSIFVYHDLQGAFFLIVGTFFSHRFTQMNRTHRVQWRWWPLPRPLPRREGAWSPRYPYGLDVSSFLVLISFYISCNALWILYAGGLLWARNVCQKGSVRSVSSVREKTSTKYASSPVGVTSHTTPLPAGEGLGEGPLSCGLETCAKMFCSFCVLCER